MSRREIVERALVGVAALVCLFLALGLALLARDVAASRSAITSGDVEYRVVPATTGLWRASTLVPFDLAVTLLGTEDDVRLRRAVRSVALARLGDPTVSVSDPQVALLRNDAQARLDEIVANAKDRRQQSRAAGLLGVIGLARLISETQTASRCWARRWPRSSSRSRSTRATTTRSTTSNTPSSAPAASS